MRCTIAMSSSSTEPATRAYWIDRLGDDRTLIRPPKQVDVLSHASASNASTKTKTKTKKKGRPSAPPVKIYFPDSDEDSDEAWYNGDTCQGCYARLGGVANYLKTYRACERCGQNICLRCIELWDLWDGMCLHHDVKYNNKKEKYMPRADPGC